MKEVDIRRCRGWMKSNSRRYDSAALLADGACDLFGLYLDGLKVPDELVEIAKEFIPEVKQ